MTKTAYEKAEETILAAQQELVTKAQDVLKKAKAAFAELEIPAGRLNDPIVNDLRRIQSNISVNLDELTSHAARLEAALKPESNQA